MSILVTTQLCFYWINKKLSYLLDSGQNVYVVDEHCLLFLESEPGLFIESGEKNTPNDAKCKISSEPSSDKKNETLQKRI